MNKRSFLITALVTIPFFFSGVMLVHAQLPTRPKAAAPLASDMYTNPIAYKDSFGTAVDSVPRFLLALVDLIYLVAIPVIVMFIIYSGFLFVTAGDNESKIGKARTVFMWTVIGAAVLLGAKAIGLAVQSTICSLDSNYSSYFCP